MFPEKSRDTASIERYTAGQAAGKIGFFIVMVVDDGESFCMRGGRIRKDYEGKGVLRFMGSYVAEFARSIGALHWSYTATDTSGKALKCAYRLENKLILTMDHLVYSLEAEKLILWEADLKQTTEVKPIPFDDVAIYISSKETSAYLFPHGRVLIDYTPYKLLETNVLLMKQTSSDHTEVFSDVRIENGCVRGSLSFGSVFKAQTVSYVYSIEIYGDDPVSVEHHVIKHLSMLKQKVEGSVCFMLIAQEGFPLNTIDNTCIEYGLTRVNHGQNTLNGNLEKSRYLNSIIYEESPRR